MFYAANNQYSNQTSVGFANTWYVLVFDSKKNRDDYVNNSSDLACRAIKRKEISKYLNDVPKPFTSECYGIVGPMLEDNDLEGFIGTVTVCTPDEYDFIEKLNK